MENIVRQIYDQIQKAHQIAMLVHTHPDGDCLGSALALAHILEKTGKKVRVISPDAIPGYLQWMPDIDKVLIFEQTPGQAAEWLEKSGMIILIDHNTPKRTGEQLAKIVEKYIGKKTFALIDHHLQPDPRIDLQISDPDKASTAELIFDFLQQTGLWDRYADREAATLIYTGIMTDTGSFRFGKTSAGTHHTAAELIAKGAPNEYIHVQVYDTYSYDKMQLLAHALRHMKIIPECGASYMVLDRKTLEKFHYRPGDTEGIVNYGISLKGIAFTTLITQLPGNDSIKLSFRSKGDFDVNEFARKYFNGGGHKNAAGGRSAASLDDTVKKLEKAIRENCHKIIAHA